MPSCLRGPTANLPIPSAQSLSSVVTCRSPARLRFFANVCERNHQIAFRTSCRWNNLQYGRLSGWAGVKGTDVCFVCITRCIIKSKNFVEATSERLSASRINFCRFDRSTLSEFKLCVTPWQSKLHFQLCWGISAWDRNCRVLCTATEVRVSAASSGAISSAPLLISMLLLLIILLYNIYYITIILIMLILRKSDWLPELQYNPWTLH